MEKLIEFPKRKLLGSFSIRDDGVGSENVTFKMNSRFFFSNFVAFKISNVGKFLSSWILVDRTEVKKEKEKFVVLG